MVSSYDFLVLGSGVAGLSFALRASAKGTVAIVTKKQSAESNTNYAQGGIAAVLGENDSYESHIQDTLVAGAGLCDRDIVDIVVQAGPDRVRELVDLGARFSHEHGKLRFGREGGHSTNRIVHAADVTGREVEETLLARIQEHPNIELLEYHFALELITEHHLGQHVGRLTPDIHCFGAYVFDEKYDRVLTILAKSTLLATGGSGRVYLHTTNPAIATGDGVAMAYRAKARVENMEFVQFHPTSLFHFEADSFLISEAVRGEGALLFNQDGHHFMPHYDDRAELAPRDIVARAIDDQLKKRGDDFVYLDISHRPAQVVRDRFPNIYETCLGYGIDITSEPIPVVPAAHYQCGGVQTDELAQTSITGLFACGEVACTGLHGANRLASNSLLEALVFAHRAADSAVRNAGTVEWNENVPEWDDSGTVEPSQWVLISHNRDELCQVMWDYVGIVRSVIKLDRALQRTRLLYEETEEFYRGSRVSSGLCELRNMIAVAYLIVRSAQMRRESRGLHYILDYPDPDSSERHPTIV